MEERPRTQQNASRPVTGRVMRPPSAFPPRTGVMPGTASRLATAMMQQPINRAGTAMGLAGAQVCFLSNTKLFHCYGDAYQRL